MLSKLKYQSNKKFYQKNVIKQTANKTHGKVENIAILLSDDEKSETIAKDLIKGTNLKLDNVRIIVLGDYHNEEVKSIMSLYFTEKDFGFGGSLKSNNLKSFVKNDFDLLISYASEDNLFVNLITLLSNAKFKIGFANIDDRLFDLIIADPNFNPSVFNKEIKKYLTILKKL